MEKKRRSELLLHRPGPAIAVRPASPEPQLQSVEAGQPVVELDEGFQGQTIFIVIRVRELTVVFEDDPLQHRALARRTLVLLENLKPQ